VDKYIVNKEDAVLLLVDLQEKLMQAIVTHDKIRKNISILIKAARVMDIPVILTEQYPKGLGPTLPEIKQHADEALYIEKVKFSAFGHEMDDYLAKIDRRTIILTGVETHICVYQTARDLVANGLRVHTIIDAVGSRAESNHINGLQLMSEFGAVVNNTETVLFDMLKTASTPEFKQISALVK